MLRFWIREEKSFDIILIPLFHSRIPSRSLTSSLFMNLQSCRKASTSYFLARNHLTSSYFTKTETKPSLLIIQYQNG